MGGVYQQATSLVTSTNQVCYELVNACYSRYGFEVCPVAYACSFLSFVAHQLYSTNLVSIPGSVIIIPDDGLCLLTP